MTPPPGPRFFLMFCSPNMQLWVQILRLRSDQPKLPRRYDWWSTARRRSNTISVLCELNYVSFSLFDSNAYAQNIFSLGEFLQKVIFMNWTMTDILFKNKQKKRVNVVHRLTNSKYIYVKTESPVHICQNPIQYTAYEHINLYIISFISGL